VHCCLFVTVYLFTTQITALRQSTDYIQILIQTTSSSTKKNAVKTSVGTVLYSITNLLLDSHRTNHDPPNAIANSESRDRTSHCVRIAPRPPSAVRSRRCGGRSLGYSTRVLTLSVQYPYAVDYALRWCGRGGAALRALNVNPNPE
jgi:hypothetical protein